MKYVAAAVITAVVLVLAAALLWRNRPGERPSGSSTQLRMPVDDAFGLKEPGKVVVVGVVAEGEVRPGARVILRTGATKLPVTVEALEAYHKPLRVARQGDRVGIMVVGASKDDVGAGAVLVSKAE